jgi:hypothetical protein
MPFDAFNSDAISITVRPHSSEWDVTARHNKDEEWYSERQSSTNILQTSFLLQFAHVVVLDVHLLKINFFC